MTSIALCRTTPLTLLIALILAISSAMFADQASASCGDYLHTSGSGESAPTPSDPSIPVCSGPHCSASSLALSPPPTAPKRNVVEIVSLACSRCDDREVDVTTARFPVQCELYSIATPDVLFRPPITAVI